MADERTLPYGRQWLDDEDADAVLRVLNGDWLTTGPVVDEFEQALASYSGARYAVVVSSGTAALHTAYASAGLTRGDSIITSPLTFIATASTAMQLGAEVRFADVYASTGTLDPEAVEDNLLENTKLIVPVDYAGHPVDYAAIKRVASTRDVRIIADAAHSLGASYQGQPVGTLADATTLSFHPVKAMTTAEGGAILTNDDEWRQRAMSFRNHGIVRDPAGMKDSPESWYYEVQSLGLNYRIPDVLCALGLTQLKKLEKFLARRREIAARYNEALACVAGLELPVEAEHAESAWHLYVIRVRDRQRREQLFEYLKNEGIGVQLHYMLVYQHPVFQNLGYKMGSCPVAEDFAARAISIPLYPRMDDADVDRVIETLTSGAKELL
jgi:perosamine synthetase